MGYTHYWSIKITPKPEVWRHFVAEAWALYCDPVITPLIGDSFGQRSGIPTFNQEKIAFNGIDQASHETFHIEREPPSATGPDWVRRGPNGEDVPAFAPGFCKTAQKPYDALVTAVLLSLRAHLGLDVKVTSDGEWDDWAAGRDLYRRVLGRDPVCPWGALVQSTEARMVISSQSLAQTAPVYQTSDSTDFTDFTTNPKPRKKSRR